MISNKAVCLSENQYLPLFTPCKCFKKLDCYSKGILERAKQRREALAKMMADTPINKRLAEGGQNDFGSQSKFNEGLFSI